MVRHFVYFFLVAILLLISAFWTGCGDDKGTSSNDVPPPVGSIEGEISLPASSFGDQMYVLLDEDTDGGNGYEGIAGCECGSGKVYDYSFTNYPIGSYYLYAIVYRGDSTSGPPQAGDYFGYYGTGLDQPDNANVLVPLNKTMTYDFNLHEVP